MRKRIHKKQQEFFKNKSRNRWIFGGNRTGKTWAGAAEAVRFATTKKCEGWVVSLSTQVQRDVAQRKILEMLKGREIECIMLKGKSEFPERGIIDFIKVDESIIGFKNCEQGREKFQGTALDWVWFDEEPSEDIYEECLARLLDRGGRIWGTMTPLKGRTWIYDRIYLASTVQSEIAVFQWEWSDNPHLNKKEIERMERNYSAETLESRKYGRFIEGLGMVFKEFGDDNIIKDGSVLSQKNNWVYTGISIDPGYKNPTAVLWFGVDSQDRIFVIDEYKESEQSVEQIAKIIKRKNNELGFMPKNIFIDSAASAETFGQPESVVQQFKNFGINVDTKVDKNVLGGVHFMKSLFCSADNTRKLFVYPHCVQLVKELRGYFWGDHNKPVKRNDHCIDALRYFVMSLDDVRRNVVQVTSLPVKKPNIFDKHKRSIMNERH
ncbi:MAG: terminase family protein [Christensenellaceae bacterium]|jgi:PBSX family phage terminase large subunit|nr:terminase family protein [Christensenellaceae bacterium]